MTIMCHFTLVLSQLLLHRTYCLPIMRTELCILEMFIMIIVRIYILFKFTLIKLDIFLISLTSLLLTLTGPVPGTEAQLTGGKEPLFVTGRIAYKT